MSPQVEAAIIAATVGVATLIATVVTQYLGRRATSRDTERAFEVQGEQLDRTLAEQRTRTLNERFAAAAEQLGSEKPAAVQLAGMYAMAGLADDWPKKRQTCVDVLCGYLRLPYDPDPERLDYRASREVRQTAIRVIAAHLKADAAVPWHGLNFDFTRVVFDGGDFRGAKFSGREVSFRGAKFSGGAEFSGDAVDFRGAEFSGHTISFGGARFSGGWVGFGGARFSGREVSFRGAQFSGSTVNFREARFSGGTVDFGYAQFTAGTVTFHRAQFSGSTVNFREAKFSGSTVDFSHPDDWSITPVFPWTDTPPPGVTLPKKEDQSQA